MPKECLSQPWEVRGQRSALQNGSVLASHRDKEEAPYQTSLKWGPWEPLPAVSGRGKSLNQAAPLFIFKALLAGGNMKMCRNCTCRAQNVAVTGANGRLSSRCFE